jgi:hypothetical protein
MNRDRISAQARKSLAGVVAVMRECGFTYLEIENELRLRPRNGMTAWDFINKHKAKPLDPAPTA